jgi:hypothetical protein
MMNDYKKYFIIIILFINTYIVYSQTVKPFTLFRVIKTEHFDIIYPDESKSSAVLLASYADRVYRQISALLGIEVHGRIPVTLTPHVESFNGYYNSAFNHIILYDTPMDLEWTNFANNLESLFLHEVTHAVSLNTKGLFYRVMNIIFGNWVNPSFSNAPAFMTEGVTVSFESLSGFGRANDPRIKEYIRQGIHENIFLTPFQASGLYDGLIYSSAYHYEYGGLFSAWLQKNYGMEKYAQLWQEIGKKTYSSFIVYNSGFYRIFKKVYGFDITKAWEDFRLTLKLDNMEENNNDLLPKQYRYFTERKRTIKSLTVRDDLIYVLDSRAKITAYNTKSGKTNAYYTDLYPYDLDISKDGKYFLVSLYKQNEDRYLSYVIEQEIKTSKKSRSIKGLYKARYFRDGVIGISSQLHNTYIAFDDFNGNREIIFKGNENFVFSGPQVIDDERITFIASRYGVRELWIYNYISKELFRVENNYDNSEYWNYARGLHVSNGKIYFSYNSNDRMYKLGIIDPETLQAIFSNRDFSGGVFNPVEINDAIYYQGSFFKKDALLRFPERSSSLSGDAVEFSLTKLNTNNLAINENQETENIFSDFYKKSEPYISFQYMNPFRFWFPLPLIKYSFPNGLSFNGAGVFTTMSDPAGQNMITVLAYADFFYKMAEVDIFTWKNTFFGFPLTFSFSDAVVENTNNKYRHTEISLNRSFSRSLGRFSGNLSFGTAYIRNTDYEYEIPAYEWKNKTESGFLSSIEMDLSTYLFETRISSKSYMNNFKPRIDSVIQFHTETKFPAHFALFGSYDRTGMNLHGISNTYGEQELIKNFTLKEYSGPDGLEINWLAGAQASIDIFSFEIQKNISHLYFNRFWGTLSLRSQIYDSGYYQGAEGVKIYDLRLIQSIMLKLNLKCSFLPVQSAVFSLIPYVYGTWNISNTITGHGKEWIINLGIDFKY